MSFHWVTTGPLFANCFCLFVCLLVCLFVCIVWFGVVLIGWLVFVACHHGFVSGGPELRAWMSFFEPAGWKAVSR